MKRSKNIIMATILTSSCLLLSGCTLNYKKGDTMNSVFKIVEIYVDENWNKIYEVKDIKTGIHYYKYGGSDGGLAPIIESDGTFRGAKKDAKQTLDDKQKLKQEIEKAEKELNKKKEEYSKIGGE